MIVDTESHVIFRVFPREWNPGQSPIERASWHEYSGDLFAAEMDRSGVDKAFLISYDAVDTLWVYTLEGGTMEDCITGRKYTLEAVRRHPERFLWFATLKHPRKYDGLSLARRDISDGALGLKIFPAYLNLRADDEDLMEAYRLCATANRRVILSFEDTQPPVTPSVEEYFEQLDRVLREFPDLKVQINHGGAGSPDDPCSDPLRPEAGCIFEVVNGHSNVLLSTAWLGKTWEDESEYPYPTYLRRLERLRDEVGIGKLMWATDWPWLEQYMNYPQAVNAITRHANFFTQEEKEAFLGGNAFRFVEDLLPAYREARIFQEH
jgi:predicted TIM-barrel fold metal-dependent hydrolase